MRRQQRRNAAQVGGWVLWPEWSTDWADAGKCNLLLRPRAQEPRHEPDDGVGIADDRPATRLGHGAMETAISTLDGGAVLAEEARSSISRTPDLKAAPKLLSPLTHHQTPSHCQTGPTRTPAVDSVCHDSRRLVRRYLATDYSTGQCP
jgi:hypothetical protein